MGSNFKVRFLQRERGAIGAFAWGEWRTVRNTTAEQAIDIARVWAGDVETAGSLCEIEQPGEIYVTAK
jgi:hypothetical protein